MAAQIVHAAGESISSAHPPHTHVVVLAVENEAQLLSIAKRLDAAGIEHKVIREVDEPYTGQHTAIGVFPVTDRSAVRKITSSLPLLR